MKNILSSLVKKEKIVEDWYHFKEGDSILCSECLIKKKEQDYSVNRLFFRLFFIVVILIVIFWIWRF